MWITDPTLRRPENYCTEFRGNKNYVMWVFSIKITNINFVEKRREAYKIK